MLGSLFQQLHSDSLQRLCSLLQHHIFLHLQENNLHSNMCHCRTTFSLSCLFSQWLDFMRSCQIYRLLGQAIKFSKSPSEQTPCYSLREQPLCYSQEKSLNSLTKWHHYLLMWFWLAWACVCLCVCVWSHQAVCFRQLADSVCLAEGFSEVYQPWQADDKVLLTTAFCSLWLLYRLGHSLKKTCKNKKTTKSKILQGCAGLLTYH